MTSTSPPTLDREGEQIRAWLVRDWADDERSVGTHGDPELRRPLGPEDEALRARIGGRSLEPLSPAGEADARMQPDGSAVCGELRPYLSQAGRSGTVSPLHRSWCAMLFPVAPVLMVPRRPVLGRARVAALASLLLVDGGLLAGWGAGREPLLATLLDLACRGRWVQQAREVMARRAGLPSASAAADALLARFPQVDVDPHPLPRDARGHFRALVGELLGVLKAGHVTPSLGDPAREIPDESNRIPLERLYDRGMRACERLACTCARVQVRAAGVSAAIAEATTQWREGAPVVELRAAMSRLDDEIGWAIELLVELARAIQKRAVQPPGIRNGLRKVAGVVDQAIGELIDRIEPLLGGAIPVTPDLWPPIHAAGLGDPLAEAWNAGKPADAVPWLLAQPPSVDRDLAMIFTRAGAGVFAGLGVELFLLSRRPELASRPTLFLAANLVAASAALHDQSYEPALFLSQETYEHAFRRRNGVLLTAAALGAIEAHHRLGNAQKAEEVRLEALRACIQLRSGAGFTLLLRWRVEDEPEEDPATEPLDDEDLPTDEVTRSRG